MFVMCTVQVPSLSVEVYLRSRGSSRRQSHPGISILFHHPIQSKAIQSQSIPTHLNPIPIQCQINPILPRHPSLLTDRVTQQISTRWDFDFYFCQGLRFHSFLSLLFFCFVFLPISFTRQPQLLLRRFVWKCHQVWPQGKSDLHEKAKKCSILEQYFWL